MAFRLFKVTTAGGCHTGCDGRQKKMKEWTRKSYEKALPDLRHRGIFPPDSNLPAGYEICFCVAKKNNTFSIRDARPKTREEMYGNVPFVQRFIQKYEKAL